MATWRAIRYRIKSQHCGRHTGRDAHYWAPPAQIRTCGLPAYGSYLGCLTAKRTFGQGCRIRGLGLKAPLILIGIYCGLGGCDFLASALLFITGGVPLPCDPVDLPFLAKVACGRLAFYSTALKL